MNIKKKISQASTFSVFIVTLVISMTVFGIIAFSIMHIVVKNNIAASKPQSDKIWYVPQKKDNQTVLIAGTNNNSLEYCCLAYYSATQQNIMFAPLPLETETQIGAYKETLKDFYSPDEPRRLCDAVQNLFDIPVKRYIEINPQMLNALVNQLGHIDFDLMCSLNYKNPVTNEITDIKMHQDGRVFSGADLRKIMTYPDFPQNPDDQMYYQGLIPCMLINNFLTLSESPVEDTDTVYRTIIRSCKTNITDYDISSRKKSFNYICELKRNPAFYSLPEGYTDSNKRYIINNEYKNNIKTCIETDNDM